MKFKLLETYLIEKEVDKVNKKEKHDPRYCKQCCKQLGIEYLGDKPTEETPEENTNEEEAKDKVEK